jgi:transposase
MRVLEVLEQSGETLSPTIRAAILLLEEENQRLREQLHRAEERIRDLEARLGMNSRNSSKPPSSDPPQAKRAGKKGRRGKRGAHEGHPGAGRELLPEERVDEVVEYRPEQCRRCGHALAGSPTAGEPGRWQVVELPPVRARVTEHRSLCCVCPSCGTRTRGQFPEAVQGSHFGPRLVAFGTMLTSRFRLSRRQLRELLSDLLDVPAPSLGSTQAFGEEVSAALLGAYQQIRRSVRSSALAWVDETGWSLRGLSRWIWVAATSTATLFRIGRNRSTRSRELLLGCDYGGVLTSDRWRAYDSHPLDRRQLCWAHLKRNLQGLADRNGPGAHLGHWGVQEAERLFRAWHAYLRGEISRAELRRTMVPVRMRLRRLLRRGIASQDRHARALSRDLLRLWPALWTFLSVEGVEPTNNRAEQALRAPVIRRKLCFGSQSGKGLRATERLLSVTQTCRLQKRNLLNYLTQAVTAHRQGLAPPALLPAN